MADVRQIELSTTSRYKGTSARKDSQGRIVFDPMKKTARMNIFIKAEGTPHTVAMHEVGRWDLIAKEKYGDERLAWAIMFANNVLDMVNDYPAGSEIKIPDRELVEAYVRSN